jgi:hypothetical protein
MNILKISGISYFSILRRTRRAKNIPKLASETRIKTQETILWFAVKTFRFKPRFHFCIVYVASNSDSLLKTQFFNKNVYFFLALTQNPFEVNLAIVGVKIRHECK